MKKFCAYCFDGHQEISVLEGLTCPKCGPVTSFYTKHDLLDKYKREARALEKRAKEMDQIR